MRGSTGIVACLTSLLYAALSFAADPPIAYQSDLYGMVGEWSGELTYLDYGSDTVRVTVEAQLSADTAGGVLITRFIYDEKAGDQMIRWGEWTVSPDGKRLNMNEEKSWFVTGKTITNNGTTLVFQAPGTDNNKPAQITHVLWIGHQDSLVFSKQVLYRGGGREFLRHEFRLGRVKE